jgi:hypothetical protein
MRWNYLAGVVFLQLIIVSNSGVASAMDLNQQFQYGITAPSPTFPSPNLNVRRQRLPNSEEPQHRRRTPHRQNNKQQQSHAGQ